MVQGGDVDGTDRKEKVEKVCLYLSTEQDPLTAEVWSVDAVRSLVTLAILLLTVRTG